MPYDQFYDIKYVYVTDTATTTKLGFIKATETKEIEHVRLDFYKHGNGVGNEQIRLNIYTDESMTKLYAQSNTVSLSDIDGLSEYWLGWLRFDYELPILAKDTNYYFGLEPVTYTRNADVFYIGAAADAQPDLLNAIGNGNGAYLEIFERSISDVCR